MKRVVGGREASLRFVTTYKRVVGRHAAHRGSPPLREREACCAERLPTFGREKEACCAEWSSSSCSRFTVGFIFPPSLCGTAFCSGITRHYYPFHCWAMFRLPSVIPVSLLAESCIPSSPVSLLGVPPTSCRLFPHNWDIPGFL